MDTYILLITAVFRILGSYFILNLNLKPYVKIILVLLTDFFDCDIPRSLKLYKNKDFCQSTQYQQTDKLVDSITYILIFNKLVNTHIFSRNEINILFYLLVYRLIGTFIFILKNQKQTLFYFPNFYLEIALLIALSKTFMFNYKPYIIYVIILKICQEYGLHHYGRYKYNKN